MLPRVLIKFSNGALGQVSASDDNVIGVLTTGAVVAGKFALVTPYRLTSSADLATLGITAENNPGIYKIITELYNQCGDGVVVRLQAYADTVTMTAMVAANSTIESFLKAAKGAIRMLFIHRTPAAEYVPTIEDGLDADVAGAVANAQIACNYAEATLKAPCFAVVSGLFYSGDVADLTDMTLSTYNRVAVMIGDSVPGGGCGIGLLAGRLASIPVQRNIGRVKDGSIAGITKAYVQNDLVEVSDQAAIHDNGFVTIRTHIGRSGYFFNDDPLCAPETDDYNHITARRTIDKAYRIAYDTLINEILDEIPVTSEGKISVAYAKSLENKVESAVVNSMTANGELGNDPADPKDNGVQCYVDYNQNIIATGKVVITLKVKPYGYARYIEVNLGFETLTAA